MVGAACMAPVYTIRGLESDRLDLWSSLWSVWTVYTFSNRFSRSQELITR